ncbi:hypothetical protein K8Q98_02255 [Candidatus Nomurabacteria bacterium]|nr:hypothetical protein [Candidatus Nomurabacteria bacterium]
MYILFTLFFVSLVGIILMIGRKLVLVRDGQNIEMEYAHPFVPDLEKIKELLNKSTKKYGYLSLVLIIRTHIRSSKFLKQKYEEIKTKVKDIHLKNVTQLTDDGLKTQEVSGFLKMISDYKHKIRTIKHKIKKEEEIG